jgi:hypothetical protein
MSEWPARISILQAAISWRQRPIDGAVQADEDERLPLHGDALEMIGTTVGLATAWVLVRWMESLLYGVANHDVVSFSLPPVVLIAVALLGRRKCGSSLTIP